MCAMRNQILTSHVTVRRFSLVVLTNYVVNITIPNAKLLKLSEIGLSALYEGLVPNDGSVGNIISLAKARGSSEWEEFQYRSSGGPQP